jgi:hypothetical protein
MATPVRFPSGVSTERLTHPLGNFPMPDPVKNIVYSNDFFTYAAGDWTVTAGGAGSSVAATAATLGGAIVITTATSGTESIIGQPSFNFNPATSLLGGLQTWFHARVTLDATVAQPDYAIGLMKGTPTTFNGATDGVWFTKATTATVWSLVIKAAAGSTTTIALPATTVPTASQTITLSFYFDGKTLLYVYFNNVCIGTVGPNGTLGTSLANLPASTILLAPAFSNSFHTGTSLLTVDYVLAAVERF